MASCAEMADVSKEYVGEAAAGLEPVEAFVKGMTGQVNATDVARMVALQQHMLSRFEKTNEMLLNFNHLSENRFLSTHMEFKKHIHLLTDTKKDLENVFRRIRFLKDKLRVRYPEAFAACAQVYHVPDDDDDTRNEDDGTHRDAVQQNSAISESTIAGNSGEQICNVTEPGTADNCPGSTFVLTGPSDDVAAGGLTPSLSEHVEDDIGQTETATAKS